MKKTILNLGKALNKADQKIINGGKPVHIPDFLLDQPCIEPVLAPPLPGCTWVRTGPCTYQLDCIDTGITI